MRKPWLSLSLHLNLLVQALHIDDLFFLSLLYSFYLKFLSCFSHVYNIVGVFV